LTDGNFDDFIGGDKYVVVKFYTKWCRYCREMAPQYEVLYSNMKGVRKDVIIARIDAEENSTIAYRYGIFSFPVVGFFAPKDKRLRSIHRGQRIATDLSNWINALAPFIEVEEKPVISLPESDEIKPMVIETNIVPDLHIEKLNQTDVTDELDFIKSELKTVKSTD